MGNLDFNLVRPKKLKLTHTLKLVVQILKTTTIRCKRSVYHNQARHHHLLLHLAKEALTLASDASHPNPKRPSLHQRSRTSQIQIDTLHPSVPPRMNSLAEKQCGNCSFKDRWLIHYLRLRGEYRRLCTSCVLKLHPASFCQVCFNHFVSPVPQNDRVTCQKCQSITHLNCCVPNSDKPHTCPPCANPSFRYFNVERNGEDQFEIDLKHAKALLCAARIAADSLTRAVHIAETDAVRKVKEAVASKKRAREGLQEICAREKARKASDDDST